MAKLKKTTAAAAAMIPSQGSWALVFCAKSTTLSMGDPLGSGSQDDLDGVRADNRHHLHPQAGGQRFVCGDGLVFNGTVLQVQMDLTGARPAAGDGQVHGAAVADGPVDAH